MDYRILSRLKGLESLLINQQKDVLKVIEDFKADLEPEKSEVARSEVRKRAGLHEKYWYISMNMNFYTNCGIMIHECTEQFKMIDNNRFDYDNYFLTEESAKTIQHKLQIMLLLQKVHDAYCPDFKAEFGSIKYLVCRDTQGEWVPQYVDTYYSPMLEIYFPSEAIAQKACDYLNKHYRYIKSQDELE